MDQANKIVPGKLDKMIDETIKSKDGKPLKEIIKDVTEVCKTVTDADK